MRHGLGIALGAWLVANVLVYRVVVRAGWPLGSGAPAHLRVDFFTVAPFAVTASALVLVFLVPVAFVVLWNHVERTMRIDQKLVGAACRWTARALTTPSSVAAITIVAALLFLPALGKTLWPIAVPALTFVVLLPFGVFDLRVASSVNGAGWWRLRWPGAGPFLALLVVVAVMVVVEFVATMILHRLPPLAPLLFIADAAVGVGALAAAGSILLFRAEPADVRRRIRHWLSWQRLGPIIALNVRLAFLLTFLAAPVFVAAVLLWKVIPLHAAWAVGQNIALPASARMLVGLAGAGDLSAIIATSWVAGLALYLGVARILWLTSRGSTQPAGA